MRSVYIALIVALAALVLVFTVQNFQTAPLSLFSASVTLPMSLLVIAIYMRGMLTDGLFLRCYEAGLAVRGACVESDCAPALRLTTQSSWETRT